MYAPFVPLDTQVKSKVSAELFLEARSHRWGHGSAAQDTEASPEKPKRKAWRQAPCKHLACARGLEPKKPSDSSGVCSQESSDQK